MTDFNSTLNNSIWNEDGTFAVGVNSDGEAKTISQIWDGTNKVTVTNNKLDVNATAAGAEPRPGQFRAAFALDGASPDMNVDGSSTPVEFIVTPNSGKIFYVHRLVITFIDASINFSKFGGIAGGITNGLKIEVKENGEVLFEVLESPFKLNSQFYEAGALAAISSAADDIFTVILNIQVTSGTTLKLIDSSSDLIKVTVQDDLTSINSLRVVFDGYEVDE